MAARKKVVKPEPRIVQTICSICGEDWAQHQEVDGEVSTLECVRLLKAKIAMRPTITIQPVQPQPYVVPYIQPYNPWPTRVWYGNGSAISTTETMTYCSNTPTIATAHAA